MKFFFILPWFFLNYSLEYKYMKLVHGNEPNYDGELPGVDSCALSDGEEEQFDSVQFKESRGSKLLNKLRGKRSKVKSWKDFKMKKMYLAFSASIKIIMYSKQENSFFIWLPFENSHWQPWGLGLFCLTTLWTIFLFCIVAISVIGGGNWSEQRKPDTCRKLLTSLTCHLDNVFNYLNMNSLETKSFLYFWNFYDIILFKE